MRILFTFAGGTGHFVPLTPIARAAAEAGHTVAFAGQDAMAPIVAAAGFEVFPTGGRTLSPNPRRGALLPFDQAREDRAVRDGYAGRVARERAAALLALCDAWRPDLVVREEMDFGAEVAAERLRLPCATLLVIATGALARPDLIVEPLNALRAEHGLAPDPTLAALRRGLVLSPFAPSLRHPAYPLPDTAHAIRPFGAERGVGGAGPAWLDELPERDTVYVTLGTVFNVECGDLYERVLAGLRPLPVNVVVTVGRERDPAELGPLPAHMRVERYVDQAVVLPHCRAVVSHAGSGTVSGALAHGLPMVLLPMGADQPLNARRCQELGVARVLDPAASTPETVRVALSALLADPAYGRAARRVGDEIGRLPGADYALELLEALASDPR